MYKKIFILIMVIIIIIVIIYIKNITLYDPQKAIPAKYKRFFRKLSLLTESNDNIINELVKTPDNIFLDTIYLRNNDTNNCIIYFHGNSGNISLRYNIIKFLYNYASVVAFDYRSYGRSSGDHNFLSNKKLFIDAKTIWNYCIYTLRIHPNNISFFGESLGCGIAINLAAEISKNSSVEFYPHSLILNSPFLSLKSMVQDICCDMELEFLGKILSLLFFNEYQSDKLVPYINHHTKIIISHSLNDEIIPFDHGINLFNILSQTHPNAQFITINGSHNNLGVSDEYIYTLANIFND
ncbi:putative peptidase S9 [Cotonvirus japonicus]|uniref:Peptidase S9 n=1 Tax=Cotonvirus japonicus TaxID=2811091 RepID=A0ABM7NTH1_9VIRU|nr:putative peptidase S9 [Cotonvirus japonicus]BCS83406.1 putative peptidase S9 [Cotonvirus japonicus]